jgi:hypothetical protein
MVTKLFDTDAAATTAAFAGKSERRAFGMHSTFSGVNFERPNTLHE